ncbi:hypothetical protein F8M41_007373 [Gigaspora margarita]|uniref:Uncharacterized protein n=1 Tax=Gigaspora margarita TaxID=4874 RepID=A0A8H3X5T0_GIGMA|nr:hypothetical protein F8M41_007373 [Gigaspora margarita]
MESTWTQYLSLLQKLFTRSLLQKLFTQCARGKGVYNLYQEIIEGDSSRENATEDGGINSTENGDIDSTEDEDVSSTEDEDVDSTEDEDISSTEDEDVDSAKIMDADSIKNSDDNETEVTTQYPEIKKLPRLICENIKKERYLMELKFHFLENFEINYY